jgi:hypothetical protein
VLRSARLIPLAMSAGDVSESLESRRLPVAEGTRGWLAGHQERSAPLFGSGSVVHGPVFCLFNLQRHLASAAFYRLRRARAFKRWSEAVAVRG